MADLVERFVIRHLTGAKANQVEEFDYSKYAELSFGRAANNDIRFDPERDSAVSREHGKIVKDASQPFSFSVVNNNSRNGIFVNKTRISGSAVLQPGDEVQLGPGGPSFQFDLNPRPASLMMSTRLVDLPGVMPTSEMSVNSLGGLLEEVPPTSIPHKTGLGKQTVERMISTERRKTSRSVGMGAAVFLLVLSGLGYIFRDKLISTKTVVVQQASVLPTKVDNGQTPEQIAAANTSKVVFIEFGYKLTYTPTGDDIYHEYMPVRQKDGSIRNVAMYITTESGQIEPLLGLKRNVPVGRPIAMSGASGTGFVVSPQGHILTNRHIAAAWHSYYDFPEDAFPGVLLVDGPSGWDVDPIRVVEPFSWVPAETQFFGKKPMSGKVIEGVNTYMDVTFNKNEQRFPAQGKPIISPKHDVAMIKVDLAETLTPVKLRNADKDIAAGQAVTVMGYPGISPDVLVGEYGQDFGNRNAQIVKVPDVTVTPGNVGKVLRGQTTGKAAGYYSEFGDYYQLTVNATGAGNSGGPTFDREGNVVGIFTASTSRNDATRITFAVPIKYGLELMGRRQVVD
ncbi:MAG: trypsin-like peptidase domain-containing protein [Cytophagaceae bacterium]|nr:trypsin-like peptidase domain-containing protein [Cytophagaceae bacterium]